ncbi:MAG: ATP-binding cassette domain-containing protein [Acidimicrobiales bacterium]
MDLGGARARPAARARHDPGTDRPVGLRQDDDDAAHQRRLPPRRGDVAVFGAPPSRLDTARRVSIGYLPQRPVLFEDLSLWQNLLFPRRSTACAGGRRARLLRQLELVDLGEDRRKLVRNSSGGMQRRLALAATLAHRPPLLLLDEPTAGIDPILRQRFWDHFRALRDGATRWWSPPSTSVRRRAATWSACSPRGDGGLRHAVGPAPRRLRR